MSTDQNLIRTIKKELAEIRKRVVLLEGMIGRFGQGKPNSGNDTTPSEIQTSILIVDDEEGVRDFLSFICESKGYRVRTADRGRDALEYIEQETPDLMFLDIHLKGGSGVELARILQRRNLHRRS
jgi:response regulator RpfG family c-di-GMP phosphodiesterase